MSAAQRYGELADGLQFPVSSCGDLSPVPDRHQAAAVVDAAYLEQLDNTLGEDLRGVYEALSARPQLSQ